MTPRDNDDAPWADPAIQAEHEAALGRFILAFNEVDYLLSRLIGRELSARGRCNLVDTAAKGPFAERWARLELLASKTKNGAMDQLALERLRCLDMARNELAHGHFDQNSFDG